MTNGEVDARTKRPPLREGLQRSPKLVELISAVPDEHRDALLPQLRAKPVRTASAGRHPFHTTTTIYAPP